MAWGYEKSFTVEHDDTVRKKLNCRDCTNYDSSDRSCMKRPFYMPEDGYGQWKNCKYFELEHMPVIMIRSSCSTETILEESRQEKSGKYSSVNIIVPLKDD